MNPEFDAIAYPAVEPPVHLDRLFSEMSRLAAGELPHADDPLFGELARLSDLDPPEPEDYYRLLLQGTMRVLGARGAAVWRLQGDGRPRLAYQINLPSLALADTTEGAAHETLLRHAFREGGPQYLPVAEGNGDGEVANHTGCPLLIVPVLVGREPVGLLEVWAGAELDSEVVTERLQFLVRMANLVSRYERTRQLLRLAALERRRVRWQAFAQQVHRSLSPHEVAGLIAAEGRAALECDRIAVVLRRDGRTRLEAAEGASTEARPRLASRMESLADTVMNGTAKLVYVASRDTHLPEPLARALHDYLDASDRRGLVVTRLTDERPGREFAGALVIEWLAKDPPDAALAAVDDLARHAATALANAYAYRRAERPPFTARQAAETAGAAIAGALVAGLLVALWPRGTPDTRNGDAIAAHHEIALDRATRAEAVRDAAVRDMHAALDREQADLRRETAAVNRERELRVERDRALKERATGTALSAERDQAIIARDAADLRHARSERDEALKGKIAAQAQAEEVRKNRERDLQEKVAALEAVKRLEKERSDQLTAARSLQAKLDRLTGEKQSALENLANVRADLGRALEANALARTPTSPVVDADSDRLKQQERVGADRIKGLEADLDRVRQELASSIARARSAENERERALQDRADAQEKAQIAGRERDRQHDNERLARADSEKALRRAEQAERRLKDLTEDSERRASEARAMRDAATRHLKDAVAVRQAAENAIALHDWTAALLGRVGLWLSQGQKLAAPGATSLPSGLASAPLAPAAPDEESTRLTQWASPAKGAPSKRPSEPSAPAKSEAVQASTESSSQNTPALLPTKNSAVVTFLVPRDAKLTVEGETLLLGHQRGTKRVFRTPALDFTDEPVYYMVQASWTDDAGRLHRRQRRVVVEPGRTYEVDLRSAR